MDKRYRQSINAVTKNLNKLSAIMSGQNLDIFGFKFSANAVADLYAKLIAKKQRFFAMRADSLWQTRSWAQNQRGKFQSGGDYSSSEITSAMKDMAGLLDNQQQKMANVAAERQRLVLDLGNDPNLSASRKSYKTRVDGYVNDGNKSALETEFVNMGRYLWHDVPKAGLSAYADTMRLRAEANGAPMNRELDPTLANWESFTHSIDTLYAIKADMATTLYGMMETYLAFREDVYQNPQQDDTLKTYRQRAQNLLEKMRPPRLGGLYVTRSRDKSYKSQTKIKYVALHDEGIEEASVNWVEGSTSTSAYSPGGSFYTIGDRSNMKLWTFKETAGEQTKDLSVAVRVRGPTGATQTRRMATTSTVDPDGPSSGRGLEAGATDDDTSPVADASLPAYEEADVGEGSAGTGGLQVNISGFGESQEDSYTEAAWTNDPSQIRFHITAYDSESDIYGHEYALGSSKGGTDVRDWTEAAGRRTNAGENRGAGANTYFKGIARGMSLEPNTPYYVSVRTENGEGLTTTDKVGVPLVYDDTAPSAPRRTKAASGSNVVTRYKHRSTAPPRRPGPLERMAPPYDGPAQNTSDGNKPSATVSWKKARDKQSGIKEYQYVVVSAGSGMDLNNVTDLSNVVTDIDDLSTANAEDVFADESRVQTTTNTQISLDGDDGLSFFGPSHVYVRAVNHAGTPGEMLRLGPIEPADHSVPNPAHIRIMTMPDGIRVYLKRPASDPETKIEGYRYRVERLDDGSVVRDYPDSGFDFDPQCDQKSSSNGGESNSSNGLYYQMNQSFETGPPGYDATGCANTYNGSSAPYLFIPDGNLPHGKKLVINLKAFNYEGGTKETTTRGWYRQASTFIMLDDTAPPEPNITSHSFDGNNVTINVDEVKDPESGIVKVEYAVRNNNNQNTRRRITWGELAPISGGPQTGSQDYSGTKDYTMNAPYMTGDPNEVGIRVTNGRGQQTVVWTDALQLNAPPGDYSDTEFTGL
ncbi:MAG: hypothetical protein BRD45_07000 [Bacteroidetes bacterium QS_8_64_10]|nr:MAG: hypothetical protein BRD45_07000 [Bacteroidetes bacterium QS_8_64_10]